MAVPFFTKRGEKMIPKLEIFEVTTVNEELEKEFNDFFTKWDLLPMFTNAHRTGTIRVSDSDARAVINSGGAYNKDLKKFSEIMDYAQDNKMYEQAVFSVIYGVKSFQKLMSNVRKVINYIEREIYTEHQYNRWNIVYYTEQLR